MASCDWKVIPDLSANNIKYIPFLTCHKFFAVDDSGSTAGSVLRRERAFVDYLQEPQFANKADEISLWGSTCDFPTKKFSTIRWDSNHGGTRPMEILENTKSLASIQKSDAWFLVTDGEIYDGYVHTLAELAYRLNVLSVPIVFLIVGSRGRTPETTDISVGISFFAGAQDTLILFKETQTGRIYVIAGKGCFAPLGGSAAAQDLASWKDIPVFEGEEAFFKHCKGLDIQVPAAESRSNLPKGVNLGPEWETANEGPAWVDLDLLPQAGLLSDKDIIELFAEEAFSNLSVAYKTRQRTNELRSFVKAQKIEQVAPKLEDVSGAATIIAKMAAPKITDQERKMLQQQLREAHSKNREQYQRAISEFATSPEAQALKKRNQLVDAALRTLASIEAANFHAEILSRRSNRARRAEVVSSETTIAMANLDLEGPACKGYCLVCCGEDEIMSICLKELEEENKDDNTTDFALNFPLAAGASLKNVNMVSSQNVCFQCALLGPEGLSIYKEKLKAIIPVVQYVGANKSYINDQLYLALTAGLATGAAGIAQLFMVILETLTKTKSWAGAGLDESHMSEDELNEALQRRKTFQWMLDQLLQNTWTRETFNETGEWVQFPKALSWVATDFETNGVASFVVTYPVAGFEEFLALGQRTGAFTRDTMRHMRISKAVYSIAAKYLADMQNAIQNADHADHSDQWKQKYLETIYQEFNTPMVPTDLGVDSVVSDLTTFSTRLDACLSRSQESGDWATDEDMRIIMNKTQVILFWLIYRQRGHCTAQTFFRDISHKEYLAGAVLDATLTVPESELHSILLSIFVKTDAEFINTEAANLHLQDFVPFSNPFGASVLHCGIEACNQSFYDDTIDPQDLNQHIINKLRQNRAQHLIEIYGIRGRFENSVTGLPERCSAIGIPPRSIHINLHISIVRTWAEQTQQQRRAIIDNRDECDAFIKTVHKRMCDQRRGNIFESEASTKTREILQSFWEMLKVALRLEGRGNEDITVYEHDFTKIRMVDKVEFEMKAMNL